MQGKCLFQDISRSGTVRILTLLVPNNFLCHFVTAIFFFKVFFFSKTYLRSTNRVSGSLDPEYLQRLSNLNLNMFGESPGIRNAGYSQIYAKNICYMIFIS